MGTPQAEKKRHCLCGNLSGQRDWGGGCGLGCTRRERGFGGEHPEGASWRERHRVPGSKARPGKQTVSHRWVRFPGTNYHLVSLLLTRNWPAACDLGSIRGSWVQASRRNSDASDGQKLTTREDWAGRCRVPCDRGHLGQDDHVPGPCEVIMGRVQPCTLSHVGTPGAAGEEGLFPLTGNKWKA